MVTHNNLMLISVYIPWCIMRFQSNVRTVHGVRRSRYQQNPVCTVNLMFCPWLCNQVDFFSTLGLARTILATLFIMS